jgi:hypothetical protein
MRSSRLSDRNEQAQRPERRLRTARPILFRSRPVLGTVEPVVIFLFVSVCQSILLPGNRASLALAPGTIRLRRAEPARSSPHRRLGIGYFIISPEVRRVNRGRSARAGGRQEAGRQPGSGAKHRRPTTKAQRRHEGHEEGADEVTQGRSESRPLPSPLAERRCRPLVTLSPCHLVTRCHLVTLSVRREKRAGETRGAGQGVLFLVGGARAACKRFYPAFREGARRSTGRHRGG